MKTRKTLSLLLAMLMLMSISVTALAEEPKPAEEASYENLDSWSMDTTVNIDLTMNMMGEEMALQMEIGTAIDMTKSPERCRTEMTTDSMGDSQKTILYYEKDGNNFTVVVSEDGGETWNKQVLPAEQFPANMQASLASFAKLTDYASVLTKTGTETIKGREATVYSGSLTGEQAADYIETTGALSALESMFATGPDAMDVGELGEMPLSIAIDNETGMLVWFNMDMSDYLQHLMDRVLNTIIQSALGEEELPEDLDLSMFEASVVIREASGDTTLYNFNEVGEIQLPET
jgi:hypothetical protein